MNYKDDMELTYRYFCVDSPEIENPQLDKNKPQREQLIVCKCGGKYRIFVNGITPISDTTMLGVSCPHCGVNASEFVSISGHSAGCFNATVSRYHIVPEKG